MAIKVPCSTRAVVAEWGSFRLWFHRVTLPHSIGTLAPFDQRGQQRAHAPNCSAAFANFLWHSETAHSSSSFAVSPRRRVDGRHVVRN
jgi:hypothetical protein